MSHRSARVTAHAKGGKLRVPGWPAWGKVRPRNRRASDRSFVPRMDLGRAEGRSPHFLRTVSGRSHGGSPMKRPRGRRRRRIALALLVLPPLFWATVLAVTPTEWARARIVARLSEATGRPTRLGRVKLGALGAVYLVDLQIGAPGSKNDNPWLKVPSTRINVSVLQLLAGQIEPNNIEVRGLSLRVLRRSDGTLELADLLETPP